jgi:hypothetical protein
MGIIPEAFFASLRYILGAVSCSRARKASNRAVEGKIRVGN